MDTPLHPVRPVCRAGRWLRRLAALTLMSGSLAGCMNFNEVAGKDAPKDPANKQTTTDKKPGDSAVVQAKSDGKLLDWPDWEWEDFDLFHLLPKAAPDIQPSNAVVLQADNTLAKAPAKSAIEAKLALAHERFEAKDYARAEKIFHRIADNEKNPPKLVQDAKFYEAECLYFQDYWPKAGDTYSDLMNKFPRNMYREQALGRMYEIANFWLEDTRQEMKEYEEKEKGDRWYVVPRFVSFERRKPLFDREGRAIQLLESVRFGDINSPTADTAMFLCGSVKFFNEDYKDADYYFTQLSQKKQINPKMAENAMKLAIISKQMSTGGADYDGRKVAEARIIVDDALRAYPELNADHFLDKQLVSISHQQAEKDFKMGEFYEHTGHLGAAAWQYDLVTRRYTNWSAGTGEFATEAAKRRDAILKQIEKDPTIEQAPTPPHKQGQPLEQAPAPRPLPQDFGPGR